MNVRIGLCGLALAGAVVSPASLSGVRQALPAPPTPDELCGMMPAGWQVVGSQASDISVICTADAGDIQANLWYLLGSGDVCAESMRNQEQLSGQKRRVAIGDCGMLNEWDNVVQLVTTVYFLVLDVNDYYYQVEVSAVGSSQPAEDSVLDPAREIEANIRAASGRPGPSVPSGPGTGATSPTGLPLCAEARSLLEGFGQDRLAAAGIQDPRNTSIAMDGEFLVADFQVAVRNYNDRHPGDRAYASDSLEQVSALVWLFSNGGILPDSITRQFITGNEAALERAIVQRTREKTQEGAAEAKLSPGEVYELALELSGGDANTAMLTAHNTIRAIGRGDGTGRLGVSGPNADFFEDFLVPVRGHPDNAGPWYHMFGTAYMEMVSQGDWSPYAGAAAAVAAGLISAPVGLVLAAGAVLWQSEINTEGSAGSRVYNGLEQVYREQLSSQKPDPEKFCFNVWGAQIGNMLYESLPYRGTRGFSEPPFSDFSPPDTEMPNFDAIRRLADARFAHVLRSPFSVEWSDGESTMVLDQGSSLEDARLLGGLPVSVFFLAEEDTWAAVWFSPEDSSVQVTFEAGPSGAELHYDRIDLVTGESAQYTASADEKGERWVATAIADLPPPELVGPDGRAVSPDITRVDLSEVPAAGDDGPGLPALAILVLCGLGVMFLVGVAALGGALFLVRRNMRA